MTWNNFERILALIGALWVAFHLLLVAMTAWYGIRKKFKSQRKA